MGEIEVGDYIVEWEDRKAAINKKKHGISFETAAEVFLDDNRIDDFDDFPSDDEDRIKVVLQVVRSIFLFPVSATYITSFFIFCLHSIIKPL